MPLHAELGNRPAPDSYGQGRAIAHLVDSALTILISFSPPASPLKCFDRNPYFVVIMGFARGNTDQVGQLLTAMLCV